MTAFHHGGAPAGAGADGPGWTKSAWPACSSSSGRLPSPAAKRPEMLVDVEARHSADRVAAQRGPVELDPEAGSVGDGKAAVGVEADALGEHEVATRRGPAGRVVRQLEVRASAHARREVQVGEEAYPVRPRVRGEPLPAGEDALGQLAPAHEAEGEHGIGLIDVEGVRLHEGLELRRRPRHLAARQAEAGLGSQRRVALDVVPGERLLQPEDVELSQSLRKLQDGVEVEGGGEIAGHAPALVEVDDDLERRPDRFPHGGYGCDPFIPPRAIDAKLDGPEAVLPKAGGELRPP